MISNSRIKGIQHFRQRRIQLLFTLFYVYINICEAFITLKNANTCSILQTIDSYYSRKIVIIYNKGDGKKKRKKKSSSTSESAATPDSFVNMPSPQRVTNAINIPVRHQIMWAQMKKARLRTSGTAFRQTNIRRTAYRKSLDEEEIEQARIERQRQAQEPDWEVILNATASSPLVIVDGYNVIHKWPRLKKWMTKGMISKARETLIHDMEELRALKGWRIEVVFDGFGKQTQGSLGDAPGSSIVRERISKSDEQASKKVTDNGVRVVYSGAGTSADGYIESRCFDAKKVTEGKLTGSLIIATDDNAIRFAAVNAGALCMSAGRMIDELKALRKATMYRVEIAISKANGHDLRPPQLQGRPLPNTLGRGNLIVEDKRSRTKKSTKPKEESRVTLDDLKRGTKSLPSWAVVPPKNNNKS